MATLHPLTITHFRNHNECAVDFAQTTVISGKNGSGKTAILEALSFLSVGRSWRVEKDAEVIKWGEDFCRVVMGDRELVMQAQPSYKRYRVNGISKRLHEVLGDVPTILLQPQDSQIIFGSPGIRRAMLDRLLVQSSKGYAQAASLYVKALKQRNTLLKQAQTRVVQDDEWGYWEDVMVVNGNIMTAHREEWITFVQRRLNETFELLMPPEECVVSVSLKSHHLTHEKLRGSRGRDSAVGSTLSGPQRDDVVFEISGHVAANVASRGQGKALILAYRMLEAQYITSALQTTPILLLDDVFAEFDTERQQRIFDLTKEYQTVITATHCPEYLQGKEFHHISLSQ